MFLTFYSTNSIYCVPLAHFFLVNVLFILLFSIFCVCVKDFTNTVIRCSQTVPHNNSDFLIDCLIRLCNWHPEVIRVVWEWYGQYTGSRRFCSTCSLVSASDSLPTDCLLFTVHSYYNLASYNLIGCPHPPPCVHASVCWFLSSHQRNVLQTHISAKHIH